MTVNFAFATPVALPAASGLGAVHERLHLADAYAIRLPFGASTDPDVLARHIFSHQPSWVRSLMAVRDMIVAGFGLKTSKHLTTLASDPKANRVGIFKVYSTNETEIVLGEDDKHLDFRLSLLCSAGPASRPGRQLTLTTTVHCHNLLGRAYILSIAPFHRIVVKASLRRAARLGWPHALAHRGLA